jgi:outer membrane protein
MLTLFGAADRLPAQTTVGIVDFQRALFGTAEVKQKGAELDAKYAPQQDRITGLTKELQTLQQKIQSASPEEQARMQAEGARKQRDLQRLSEDLQSDFEFDRNTILQAAREKMLRAIQTVAEAKGLDLVAEASSTYYFKPAMDITPDATAAYDKAYPVAGAASPPAQ